MMLTFKHRSTPGPQAFKFCLTPSLRLRLFSTQPTPPTEQKQPESQAPPPKGPKPSKVTPKSGLKMPKLQEGESVIGFRPYGNNDL